MVEIPKTVGVILDGNRRYAKLYGKDTSFGHRSGAERMVKLLNSFYGVGVKNLILYAFSTENFNRPKEEVDEIMSVISDGLDKLMSGSAEQYGCKVRVIGNRDLLIENGYSKLVDKINTIEEKTKSFDERNLIFAIAYGGRDEIINATKKFARDVKDGKIDINDLDEKKFKQYLYTYDIPDPDIIIRTSGEHRLSNFLLWQAAYSQLYFVEQYLPSVTKLDVVQMLYRFNKIGRRYGK